MHRPLRPPFSIWGRHVEILTSCGPHIPGQVKQAPAIDDQVQGDLFFKKLISGQPAKVLFKFIKAQNDFRSYGQRN